MEIAKTDVAVFTYTLAAVFTGTIAVDALGAEEKIPALLVSAALAVLWTAYFKYSMVQRFSDDEGSDGSASNSGDIGGGRPKDEQLGE